MKYTQSCLPYVSILLILLVLAVFDAIGSVQSDSVLEINVAVTSPDISPTYRELAPASLELITESK